MATLIRKQLRNFVAIVALAVVAMATTYYILQEQRLRIPVLEEKPFELKAEFETAQAVVPGQGQTIRVAGVRVGDVEKVDLVDGAGIVTFAVDRKYLPIYKDATILMRPTTGLKDMFFDMDPGSPNAGDYAEGSVVPMANTAPDVNLDEILAFLDSDTQAYLRLLLVGAGEGLRDRDRDLGKLLGSFGPLNRDFGKLNREVASRRAALARLIHSFNVLTTEVGRSEQELTRLVSASDVALGAIAEQDPSVQRTIALLPSTLAEAQRTLTDMEGFAKVLGPAFNELRPFARNLPELNESTKQLATAVTPVLEDEIRPFVRTARDITPDLRRGATSFVKATPRLTVVGKKLNRLFNLASYNPGGAEDLDEPGRDEGYLYWVSWLGHNSASAFSAGDGNGFYRRVYMTLGCENIAALISDPAPQIEALTQLITGFTDPVIAAACPN